MKNGLSPRLYAAVGGVKSQPPPSSRRPASVAAFKETAGDDLGLNFGSALEDVEDARIAKDAADLEFKREAVAAVDLQRLVGGRPGDAGGKKFRHAHFHITQPFAILIARGVLGDMAGDN